MEPTVEHAPRATVAAVAGFRGDVDGLRAVAILLVVAYHADLAPFRGGFVGVDVFFVISGFLITRNLVAEQVATGRVGLVEFWAKRMRRLVPAMLLMVSTTLAIGWWVLPEFTRDEAAREGFFSVLYLSNVLFARQSSDYFGGALDHSPFLHTWSLGVEEQFYLLWPILFAVAALVGRRWIGSIRPLLATAFAASALGSFLVNVSLAESINPWSFYGLHARWWEFALAGLFVFVGPSKIRSRSLGVVLGFGGLALIVGSAVMYKGSMSYPGVAALAPVAGTLMVITAGVGPLAVGVTASSLLRASPLQWLGRVSYSWYLWHWPAMILTVAWLRVDDTSHRVGAAIASLGLAALTLRYVENPLRFSQFLRVRWWRTYAASLGATAVVAVAAGVLSGTEPAAGSLAARIEVAIEEATLDCAETSLTSSGVEFCAGGDPQATTQVLLVGDSHARQWQSALSEAGRRGEFRVNTVLMSGCPLVDVNIDGRTLDECRASRGRIQRAVDDLRPDVVAMSMTNAYGARLIDEEGRRLNPEQAQEVFTSAVETFLQDQRESGWALLYLLDQPPARDEDDQGPYTCIAAEDAIEPCERSVGLSYAQNQPARDALLSVLGDLDDVSTFSIDRVLCDTRVCHLEVDGQLVYTDHDHLTRGFTWRFVDELSTLVSRVSSGEVRRWESCGTATPCTE